MKKGAKITLGVIGGLFGTISLVLGGAFIRNAINDMNRKPKPELNCVTEEHVIVCTVITLNVDYKEVVVELDLLDAYNQLLSINRLVGKYYQKNSSYRLSYLLTEEEKVTCTRYLYIIDSYK